jgi:hypothetical protein
MFCIQVHMTGLQNDSVYSLAVSAASVSRHQPGTMVAVETIIILPAVVSL